MNRFFTLAIVAMIATLSFGQTFKSAPRAEKAVATVVKEAVVASNVTTQHKVAPKAETEVVATNASAEYYAEDGDWYVVLYNSTMTFRFDVVTNSSTPLEFDHTYTLADMDAGYSYFGQNSTSAVTYTAANLTPKQGAYGTDYDATVTLKNGNFYHILYTASAPEVYDVTITSASATYYGEPDYDWFIYLSNNDYEFRFDIGNQSADGLVLNKVYTLDDMIANYSWGKDADGQSISYKTVSFKATEGANGNDYSVTVVDMKDNTYNLTYTSQPLPEPTDTVVVVFTKDETDLVDATAVMGLFQFDGLKEATGFEAFVAFISEEVAGEYTYDDLYENYSGLYLDSEDEEGVGCLDVTATVTEYEGGAYKAVVDYLGTDTVLYKFTFNYGDVPFTAINDITTEAGIKTIKTFKNGQIVIVKGEKAYNVAGQAIK